MYTEIIVSVRGLVEFILRSGDLDNRGGGSPDAMLEGARMHRKLQQEAGADYLSEVPLKTIWHYGKKLETAKEGPGLLPGPSFDVETQEPPETAWTE